MASTVSVIIPTTGNRHELLARAISSAASPRHRIEVLVVVNGPRVDGFALPEHTFGGPVRIIKVAQPGVSNARNIGLDYATGELVRFLDDDDYLFPEAASRQYDYALSHGATVVSSLVKIEDLRGKSYGESAAFVSDDPYCELLAARMVVLPLAHVYRKSAIEMLRWDSSMNNAEDVDWLHRVARAAEQRWLPLNEVVGIWFQHAQRDRLSFISINNQATAVSAEAIIATHQLLAKEKRLNQQRSAATALGLWHCAHKAFYLSPCYWTKIVKKAVAINGDVVKLSSPIYRNAAQLHISPLFIDWAMIPKRYLNHFARLIMRLIRGDSYVRRF